MFKGVIIFSLRSTDIDWSKLVQLIPLPFAKFVNHSQWPENSHQQDLNHPIMNSHHSPVILRGHGPVAPTYKHQIMPCKFNTKLNLVFYLT